MKRSSPPKSWLRLARCAALVLLLPGLHSCQLADPNKLAEAAKHPDDATQLYPTPAGVDLSPESQEINDAARLLAGLQAVPGQDVHKWRSEDFWSNYQQGTQFIWNEFASKRGAKVREWAAAELADLSSQPVVFQPFGGPNFVLAHLLFPEADTFVLCGKAPCIEMPKLHETTADTMADLLFALRETQATLLDPGQHVPPTGSTDASRSAVPVLLALAARTGHVVESIELMPEETPEPVVPASAASSDPVTPPASPVGAEHPVSACVLSLRCGDGRARRIFYFQQTLTDDGLPEGSAMLQFLSKQDKVVAVLDSTGYDLHKPACSRLQQYLLGHAAAVVQDPSGLPVRVFDRTAWNLRCYGTYAAAPNEFRDFEQPDLVAAFKDEENRPDPLPFGRGKVGEESPAAMIVARPLLAANELPFDTNVVPLEPQLGVGAPISDARPLPPPPVVSAPATLEATIPPPESTIPAAGSPVAQQ